jgi:hypothetical protein
MSDGRAMTVMYCFGFGNPMSCIEFEEEYWFSQSNSIRIFKNGWLWLAS